MHRDIFEGFDFVPLLCVSLQRSGRYHVGEDGSCAGSEVAQKGGTGTRSEGRDRNFLRKAGTELPPSAEHRSLQKAGSELAAKVGSEVAPKGGTGTRSGRRNRTFLRKASAELPPSAEHHSLPKA